MAKSPASLVRLWERDGQSSSGTKGNNEIRFRTAVAGPNVTAELIKYYQKHGMENMAKEVGIINGDSSATKTVQVQSSQKKAIIAVPVINKCAVASMSPFKMEQAILPKTVHLSSSPVILSTPQRVLAGVISSPRTPQSFSSPSDRMTWSGKRPQSSSDCDYSESKKCKKGEKGGKGLRHFSMKVCEKVRRKGTTSYNEVADELVAEFTDPHHNFSPTEQAYDQKNIRRRVYDALNVLMAMNIISKEKKEIKWLGLPTNSAQEYQNLEREKQKRIDRIRMKMQHLQELIHQQVAFKNLVERNSKLEKQNCFPQHSSRIHLPFIIVNTDKQTVIDCSISPDKTEYLFHFNDTFQIHDDVEILKRMGMVLNLDTGGCSPEELEKAKQLVPKALQPYVVQMAEGESEYPPGMRNEGNGIRLESDLYSDGISYPEPSSSSAHGSEYGVNEIAMESAQVGSSRQSSAGSPSDVRSRQGASSPSEDLSDSDLESSGVEDI